MIKFPKRFNFNKLGVRYIIALSIIAVVVIVGQILIQGYIENQKSDSRVINLAGRQRMLSQRIALYALKLSISNPEERQPLLDTLSKSLRIWQINQEGLRFGNDSLKLPDNNSQRVKALYESNEPFFKAMLNSGFSLVEKLKANHEILDETFRKDIQRILENAPLFLNTMDAIVFKYDQEAGTRVKNLMKTGYIILFSILGVILLMIFFVFIPTTTQVKVTISKLIDSEKQAQKMAKEINNLYLSLEKSYKELTDINIVVENPKTIAKADRGGNVFMVAQRFTELTGYSTEDCSGTIAQLFHSSQYQGDFMDQVIDEVSEGKSFAQEVGFIGKEGNEVWLDVHIVPVYDVTKNIKELVVLAADLSERKYAELNLRKKDLEWVEKKINEQKYRSVLILEGQEEERKRIAMDIHDGIGQLLTSLKFQIESINPNNYHDAKDKIFKIRELIKRTIKETRRVTFDLKPSVLNDYGIHAGLSTYVKEVDKLTDERVVYINSSNFNHRFPKNIENNIYRIVQEAVNNAIKYAGSEEIRVKVAHDDHFLYISVEDDGKGFNSTILNTHQMVESTGNGIFNMQERADYIDGEFAIDSSPDGGTKVKLRVPLKEYNYHDKSINEK